ncbi:MAG TPA: hypothetical protein VFK14_11485 [Solirubrobacterales bacterium]|nr:hypothetical protein [Solirubrobacterales bacterium]
MRDLYATTLQLVHLGGESAFDVAAQRAIDWAWRIGDEPPDLKATPSGNAGDLRGTSISWSSLTSRHARAVEIRLRHPDSDDPTSSWSAYVAIAEVDNSTRATVKLSFGATVHTLIPSRLSVRAPLVVTQLMEAPLLAYAGSVELRGHPDVLPRSAVPEFIQDRLEAEGRALPILVAASEVDRPLVEALGRGLAGIAQVVRSQDRAVDIALRDALRSTGYTVPRGGVRLFWPGFGSDGQPSRNPYWTRAQLQSGRSSRVGSVLDQLVDLLGPISTARVPADPALLRVRQESLFERNDAQRRQEEAKRQRARRQREAARRAQAEALSVASDDRVPQLQERVAEVEALLDHAESERKAAERRITQVEKDELKAVEEAMEFNDRAEQLQEENADLRRNLQTIQRFDGLKERDGERDPVPEGLGTWEEIGEHVEDLEGPGFCLTAQAKSCADGKNRYPHPGTMWESLRSLERVGRTFNEMGAELGMRFDQFAAEQEGLTIALKDSSYEDCWFEFEGAWHERVPHVKIDDAKSPNEVGRIYFALDTEEKRIIVDWFGTKPDRPQTRRGIATAA